MRQIEAPQDLHRPGLDALLARGDGHRPQEEIEEPLAGIAPRAHHHVLQHRQPAGEARDLEAAPDAIGGDQIRPAKGTRRSSRRTVPLSGSWMPETTLISVDLPEPLGPTIPTMLPGAAVMLTPPRARKPPKETLMSAIVNTVELPGFGDEALGPIEEDQHQDQAEARQPQIGDEVRGQIGPLRDEAGRDIGELDQDGAEDDSRFEPGPPRTTAVQITKVSITMKELGET